MKRYLLVSVAIICFFACTEKEEPVPPVLELGDPREIAVQDSLLGIYGSNITTKGLRRLDVYHVDEEGNIHLTAQKDGLFWVAVFSDPGKKILEKTIDLSIHGKIEDPYHRPIKPFEINGEYIYQIITLSEKNVKERFFEFTRTLIKPDLNTNAINHVGEKHGAGEGYDLTGVFPWSEGYLFRASGTLYASGKSGVIYLPTSFDKLTFWEVSAEHMPDEHSISSTPSTYYNATDHGIRGYDFESSTAWNYSWISMFGYSSCIGCNLTVEQVSAKGAQIEYEVVLSGKTRKVIVDVVSGKLIENAEIGN